MPDDNPFALAVAGKHTEAIQAIKRRELWIRRRDMAADPSMCVDHDLKVTLKVLPKLRSYASSIRHRIKSRSWGANHDGMSLYVTKVEKIKRGEARLGGRRSLKAGLFAYEPYRKRALGLDKVPPLLGKCRAASTTTTTTTITTTAAPAPVPVPVPVSVSVSGPATTTTTVSTTTNTITSTPGTDTTNTQKLNRKQEKAVAVAEAEADTEAETDAETDAETEEEESAKYGSESRPKKRIKKSHKPNNNIDSTAVKTS
ncbi:hypothetical protein F4703DRAFT_1897787 [Phycomyces blakesleeanus]